MAKKTKPPASDYQNSFSEQPRELIVIAKPEVELRAWGDSVSSAAEADVSSLASFLKKEKCSMQPLFGMREDKLKDKISSLTAEGDSSLNDMVTYYQVDAADSELDSLCEKLNKLDLVEAAYVKPPIELAAKAKEEEPGINEMLPSGEEGLPATPDFTSRQTYLDPAPAGIDARYAWTIPGGRGQGIKIIDCEWGWNFTHEDLLQNSMGVVVGVNSTSLRAINHGTAVIGEIGGDRNSFGVTGICSDARVGGASFVTLRSAQAIRQAADRLSAGDILLLEIHRAGPRFNFQGRQDQRGYIAIEWWPDDFAAIRYAVNKGIIVVEAAGNGRENLDDPIYNNRPFGFPASWRNPFNPANPSSQAVVVGAGAPPPGTHGRNHGPDRSRLAFSNYGRRVDCQGYGREVTSTGYGDLQNGPNRNEWYTDEFSGTSSASPIVVGALGCVQGILRNQGGQLLTSQRAINLLRSTGTPQTSAPGRPSTQRIGNRPNLRQLIPAATSYWTYNRQVIRVYSHTVSEYAWVILNGTSWIRISPNAPDGVTNIMTLLGEALANNRLVNVYLSGGQVHAVILK